MSRSAKMLSMYSSRMGTCILFFSFTFRERILMYDDLITSECFGTIAILAFVVLSQTTHKTLVLSIAIATSILCLIFFIRFF